MKKLLCKTTIDMSFKMYRKISLIFLFALLSIIHGEVKENAPPYADTTNFGRDKYCILEYGVFTDKNLLAEYYPGAEIYSVAKLTDYKPQPYYSELIDYSDIAMLPQEGAVVYAVAVLMPLETYEKRVTDATTTKENEQFKYVINVAVEVTVDGKPPLNVACNICVPTENVEGSTGDGRPFKSDLDLLVAKYKGAGFPDDYVNDIAKWKTQPDPPCDDD